MSEKTQFVLVETLSQYRMRYVVEVPVGIDERGKDKSHWALDSVACEDAIEFSQEYLGESTFSHRVVNEEEILALHAADHPLWVDESKEKKFEVFVTVWPPE